MNERRALHWLPTLFRRVHGLLAGALLAIAVAPCVHADEGLATLHIVKSFGAATVPVNGSTTLTVQLTNEGTSSTVTPFIDLFPAGLMVAASPNVINTCGGAITAAPGSNQVSLDASGTALEAGKSCSVTVGVKATTAGTKTNTAGVSRDGVAKYRTSTAVLEVGGAMVSAANAPSLGQWVLVVLVTLFSAWAGRRMRGRRKRLPRL